MSAPPAPSEPGLARLGRLIARHRRATILAWVVLVALAVVGGPKIAGEWTVDYNTPGSDSQAVERTLQRSFTEGQLDTLLVLWREPAGAKRAAAERQLGRVLAKASAIPGVSEDNLASARRTPDGRYGLLQIPLDGRATEVAVQSGPQLVALAKSASADGLTLHLGGQVMSEAERGAVSSEGVGLAVALVILLLTFGSIIAAGLPLATALAGIGTSVALIGLLARLVDTPDWAESLAVMVGIGVGIDYALLILTRFRAARAAQASTSDAVAYAMATAGRSVLVAGGTVVVSMLGLLLMGLPYLRGVALAASLSVLVVMLASLTLLPALLALAGRRADSASLRIGRRRRAAKPAPAAEHSERFARWSGWVQRRPVIAALLGLALLVGLTLPITGVRLGYPGAVNDPAGTSSRQAAELMREGFGAGAATPLQVVAPVSGQDDLSRLTRLGQAVASDDRVASVAPVQPSADGRSALLAVQSVASASSATSSALLSRIRDEFVPASGLEAKVGGWTAQTVDQSKATAQRLPVMFLGVALLSGLLLMMAFRSWLVPLKAGVLNLLSIFAAYGVVAAVAEGGAVGQLLGFDSEVPIPPFIPILMFAILFGLSMDYEVFLVSRMRELWAEDGDASAAITRGLATTAG